MTQDNAMTIAQPSLLPAGPGRGGNAFISDRLPAPRSAAVSGSAGWDSARARIAGMNPAARVLAARQAEILAVAGQGLAARPYAERKAILAHMAPHLAALGVEAGPVDAFDPTDANLSQAVGEAVILRGLLGGAPAVEPDAENQTGPAGNSGGGPRGQGLTTAPGAPMSSI